MDTVRGTTYPGYLLLMDYVGGSDPIYLGSASPGSATASAVWLIRKLTYDGSGNLTSMAFANGSRSFNQIWDNRAGLTYS